MNIKGNTKKAYEQFSKDYLSSLEHKTLKESSKSITYEDIKVTELVNYSDRCKDSIITVVGVKKVTTIFGIPDVYTTESKRLNDKLRKKNIL